MRPLEVKGDRKAAVTFLQEFLPNGPWLLCAFDTTGGPPKSARFGPEDVHPLSQWLAEHIESHNLYFHVNPTRKGLSKKATKTDVTWLAHLHVDADPRAGEDFEEERKRILDEFQSFEPTPTWIIDSGGGYWAFWRLSEPLKLDRSEEAAEDAKLWNVELERKLGGDNCHNIDRIARLPGSINFPDAKKQAKGRVTSATSVVSQTGLAHAWSEFIKADPVVGGTKSAGPLAMPLATGEATRLDDVHVLDKWNVPDRVKAIIVSGSDPDNPKDGDNSRSGWLFDVVCNLVRCDVPGDVIYSVITDSEFEISASVLDKGRDAQRYATRTIARAMEEAVTEFQCTGKNGEGPPRPNLHNARVAINRLGVQPTFDEFRQKLLIQGHAFGNSAVPVTDRAMSELRQLVLEQFNFDPGKDYLNDAAVQLCFENAFNPVREYLDALKWDGNERLSSWLNVYLGAEESEYVSAVGRIMLIAAVRRTRSPGCKFDTIVVLEGRQGTGKSTALLVLAGHDDFFSDSDILAGNAQQQAENIEGVWFYELAELEGLRAAQVTKVKAFASRQHDRARAAYGRHREDKPRQCIFVGTTNDTNYLADRTGNRRFLPVLTNSIDLEALKANRDQLMAEAAEAEANGEQIYLAANLWTAASEEQSKRLHEDPWESILAEFEANPMGDGPVIRDRSGKEKVFTKTILGHLEIDKGDANVNHTTRIGSIMRGLGWTGPENLKIGGKQGKGYWRWVTGSEREGYGGAS